MNDGLITAVLEVANERAEILHQMKTAFIEQDHETACLYGMVYCGLCYMEVRECTHEEELALLAAYFGGSSDETD
jgi:ferredoxin